MTLDELIAEVKGSSPDGTPLDHLAAATQVAQHLDELADHLVGHFVDQARRSGASWTMIGQSMGMTKQAAQKRSVPGDGSYERFTDRAKVVALKAQNEARNRGHAEVTSLHLVLGLLAEWEGFAGQAIESAGATKEQVAAATVAALPPDAEPIHYHVPYSAGMKKTHELIVRTALRMGHNYVGTEHVLIGLLENDTEPGARVLAGLGVTKAGVEQWTIEALAAYARKKAERQQAAQ
ncbi:Clp protease N-terminal domain-containing protein [Hamadaea tsunoensis]|uniref:Clp protease N-terminal domain-containing protein n=1 Tax=Hamadaea tsunoensis TaxID=53368 RepID=UPI00042A4BD9|nr:Clp protease N-terminal domain-containing protein [Hamadaea tsunoensis]